MESLAEIQENNMVVSEDEKELERVKNVVIDYKMITFSLSGKDYAINIMDVKEIAKTGCFTYVPNTLPFVLGVYNLRGEIIPIIDLRIFFHISSTRPTDNIVEDMIIVTVEEQIFGIVVDSIDKVVGISKNTIQPPHPIFGDINIKYIKGVVENQNRLYILLDVQKIFGSKSREAIINAEEAIAENNLLTCEKAEEIKVSDAKPVSNAPSVLPNEDLDVSFISQTLATFKNFYVTSVNEEWVNKRFQEWKKMRSFNELQLKNEADASLYLETFSSPFADKIWSDEYSAQILALLPNLDSRNITVWNIGCGKGAETFSLAVLLKERYGSSRVKIYANDSDLLGIANAANYSFSEDAIPERIKPYLVKGVSGRWTFNQEIRDMILFEYHDCTNENPYPEMDLIFCRDLLSFLKPEEQNHLVSDMKEKLKESGCVFLGQNEVMPHGEGWNRIVKGSVAQFNLS